MYICVSVVCFFLFRRVGEVIEGSEDDIRATYYMLAFQRDFLEQDAELRWKVVDMTVIGGELAFRRISPLYWRIALFTTIRTLVKRCLACSFVLFTVGM